MSTEQGWVGFRVEGSFITDFARNLLLEGNPDQAVSFLGDLSHDDGGGMSLDEKFAVLRGQKRLEGCNLLDLVDEPPETAAEWLDTVRSSLGILVRHKWRVWKVHSVFVYTPRYRHELSNIAHEIGRSATQAIFGTDDHLLNLLLRNQFGTDTGVVAVTVPVTDPCEITKSFIAGRHTVILTPLDSLMGLILDGVDIPPVEQADIRSCRRVKACHNMNGLTTYYDPAQEVPAVNHAVNEESALRLQADGELAFVQQADELLEDYEERVDMAVEARKMLNGVREKVLEANGPEMLTIKITSELSLLVPKVPFTAWSMRSKEGGPKWEPFSPPDMKQLNDNLTHTDWVVGATVVTPQGTRAMQVDDWIDGIPHYGVRGASRADKKLLEDACYAVSANIQYPGHPEDTFLPDHQHRAVALTGKGIVRGVARHLNPGDEVPPGTVVVLRDGRPEQAVLIDKGLACITPMGGAVSHLAQVSLERDRILVRVTDAREVIPDGEKVLVDATDGFVFVLRRW